MDAYEFNKIAGAVLGSLLVLVGTKVLVDELTKEEEEPAVHRVVAGAEGARSEAARTEAAPAGEGAGAKAGATTGGAADTAKAGGGEASGLAALLSAASAERGAKLVRKCAACHSFTKGGPNKVGPALYGVVGRDVAAVPGFSYSKALRGKGGKWTYEQLDCFLAKPRKCVPGTKMAFAGLRKERERADLIAYLRTLSDNPLPLP